VNQGDVLDFDLRDFSEIKCLNATKNMRLNITHSLTDLDIQILKEGGKLPYINSRSS
jgi:hypothetical protein